MIETERLYHKTKLVHPALTTLGARCFVRASLHPLVVLATLRRPLRLRAPGLASRKGWEWWATNGSQPAGPERQRSHAQPDPARECAQMKMVKPYLVLICDSFDK